MGLLILSDREVTLESSAPGGQAHGAGRAVPAGEGCPETAAPLSVSNS